MLRRRLSSPIRHGTQTKDDSRAVSCNRLSKAVAAGFCDRSGETLQREQNRGSKKTGSERSGLARASITENNHGRKNRLGIV